jgi:hypothetical protein
MDRRDDRPGAGRTATRPVLWTLAALALALAAFAAGRLSAPQPQPLTNGPTMPAGHSAAPTLLIQAQRAPDDPRELIPLPGPGQQPAPGEGEAGECPLFLYQDGQLFRFDAPGGQPNGQPGQGGSPELFPLQPPGQPFPLPPQEEPNLDLVRLAPDHPALIARR